MVWGGGWQVSFFKELLRTTRYHTCWSKSMKNHWFFKVFWGADLVPKFRYHLVDSKMLKNQWVFNDFRAQCSPNLDFYRSDWKSHKKSLWQRRGTSDPWVFALWVPKIAILAGRCAIFSLSTWVVLATSLYIYRLKPIYIQQSWRLCFFRSVLRKLCFNTPARLPPEAEGSAADLMAPPLPPAHAPCK